MLALLLGIAGFVLFFLYEINGYLMECFLLRAAFFSGSALIGVSILLDVYEAWQQGAVGGAADWTLLLLALLAFGALLYCLFFALPFKETYIVQSSRRVYDGGVYALCRHPGVLCFFAMCLFLGLAALPAPMLCRGMIFSLLNAGYAWFQDRVTFPQCFSDYGEYRKRTPFIVPTKDSIRQARKTWRRSDEKEEIP